MREPDLAALWTMICEKYQSIMSPVSYETWFKSSEPVQYANHTLVVNVKSKFHRDYWNAHLIKQIPELIGPTVGTSFSVIAKLADETNPLAATTPNKTAQAPEYGGLVAGVEQELPSFMRPTHLNDKYTFESFVIGAGNQLAHAAALAVAEEPGAFYNPLFFYGGVGLGKTHLMHAIGHQMLKSRPDAKIKYVTSEQFANDFINSIQTKRQKEFREVYRSVDLLLVDDIQFFADKVGTQEEFFHTFNALYDNKKQIVLTSDRLPNEIPKLQQRLVSRFKWGLSVDITPPDFETRIAILRNKAEAEGLAIPEDTLNYIAGQIDSNIRELEGALVSVRAYASTTKQPITTSLAADALKNLNVTNSNHQLTIAQIQEHVAKYYNVSISDLKGKKRVKAIVIPRQIAMYLARELTDASLPKIGNEFGGKDHTTVIHAHEKISEQLSIDDNLAHAIGDLKNELRLN